MRPHRWIRPSCVILAITMALWAFDVSASTRTRIAVVDLESQGEKAKSEELGKIAAQWLATSFVILPRKFLDI